MHSRWKCGPGRAVAGIPLLALLGTVGAFGQEHADTTVWAHFDQTRTYLTGAAKDSGFSGVVLIGRADEVVFERAYGSADADLGIPMRTDYRFRLGSLTKPITASAVLMAVDRGLLTLGQAVCPLLPSCPESWKKVTVRDLLTHTSGIRDHFGDLKAVPVEKTVEELGRVLRSLPPDESLLSSPGATYEYSNFNYVLLGAVLEKVTGKPWARVLHDWIFGPLHLKSMAYDDVYAVMKDRVRGYERDDTLGLRNIDYHDHAAYAAGGLLSNAQDLFRWSRAVMDEKLFGPELVKQSFTPYKGNYGFGWQIRQFFGRTIYDHTGEIDGFSSHLAYYPDDELTIIVLSNVENDSAILRACDIAARLFDWPILATRGQPELTPQQRCGLEQ